MKYSVILLKVVVCASVLLCSPALFADGSETLGPPSIAIQPGSSLVVSGVGLSTQPGNLLVNVPSSAVIKQVLVYWAGRDGLANNPNDLLINGVLVKGQNIGGPFPPRKNVSYRADITNLGFVRPGPNALTLEDKSFGVRYGASVMVIFDERKASQFKGRAIALSASAANLALVNVADTGPLPAAGGALDEEVASVDLGLVSSATLRSSTVGAGAQTDSSSEVEALNIALLGQGIKADVLESSARAACTATQGITRAGSSAIANLRINNTVIPITGQPNQTVTLNLLVGRIEIVINQQVLASNQITVNALAVTAKTLLGATLAKVVVASSNAGITCGPTKLPSTILVRDGNDVADASMAAPKDTTVPQMFQFSTENFDRHANLVLFAGSASATRPDVIQITSGGVTTRVVDAFRSGDGQRWDTLTVPVTVPAGAGALTVQLLSERDPSSSLALPADELVWVNASLVLPNEPPTRQFSGRATVAKVSLLGLANVTVADTGPLPSSGGTLEDTIAAIGLPGVLSSATASARTTGAGSQSNSEATVENLSLAVGGVTIAATVIKSEATAACTPGAAVNGNSVLANLKINGVAVTVSGLPNQTISVGPLTIIINEQVAATGGGAGTITVNALHVIIPGLDEDIANIVIASSHADIGGCQ
jgi:hypothetical protein